MARLRKTERMRRSEAECVVPHHLTSLIRSVIRAAPDLTGMRFAIEIALLRETIAERKRRSEAEQADAA